MFEGLMVILWPLILGGGFYWFANRCRGRNAKNAFRFAAWGSWLFLLTMLPLPFFILNFWIVKLIPSVVCFFLAASSMLKEMRAQKVGDFTDAA